MTDTITNFKLKDFLIQSPELIEEYSNILSYSLPFDTKNTIYKMKLKDVDFIKTSINDKTMDSLLEIISLVQDISVEQVLEIPIVEFYGLVMSVKKQMEIIFQNESKVLQPKYPNVKWEMVGGSEKMEKFGLYNTLESLSNGDVTKYEYISNMPYDEIFTILYMRTLQNDLIAEMDKIKTNKTI